MTTQLIVGGMGGVVGLYYPSLDFVMSLNEVANKKDCFSRLRVMERRFLELANSEVKKRGPAA